MAKQVTNIKRNTKAAALASTATVAPIVEVKTNATGGKVLQDLTETVDAGPDAEKVTAEEARSLNANADKRKQYAKAIADRLDEQDGFEDMATEFTDAKLTLASGPVAMALFMRDANVLETDNDKEFGWLSRMKVPGTENTKKEPNKYDDPAWYPVTVVRKNGVSGKSSRNTYADIWDATAPGTEITRLIAEIEKGDNGSCSAWSDSRRDREKANAETRRASGTACLEKAVSIMFQLCAIRDKLPLVVAEFAMDEDDESEDATSGVLVKAMQPIYLASRKQAKNFKNVTVTQFLSLKVDEAVANGGTFTALIATMAREEPDNPDLKDEVDLAQADTDMIVHHVGPALHRYLGMNMRTFKSAFSTRKPEDSDAELCTWMEILDMLDEFRNTYKPRFELLQRKVRDKQRQELAAKGDDVDATLTPKRNVA